MSTVNVRPLMYFAHLLTVMKKAEIFHSRNQKLQKPCIGLFFFFSNPTVWLPEYLHFRSSADQILFNIFATEIVEKLLRGCQ